LQVEAVAEHLMVMVQVAVAVREVFAQQHHLLYLEAVQLA
jgi:hypothetical protein